MKRYTSVANTALQTNPPSVMLKSQIPPSNNAHDYLSQAQYFWPNTQTANGLPYVSWPGHINPEFQAIPDSVNMEIMMHKFTQLSIAYFYTGDLIYAQSAANFIRVWFLDPETSMTPNMNFAGYVPGFDGLRGQGIPFFHLFFKLSFY